MNADPQGEAALMSTPEAAPDETYETPQEAVSEEPVLTGPPPSVFDTLRRQYSEADSERRTTLAILPGRFNSALAARFRPVPFDQTRKRARMMVKRGETPESELNFSAGIIAEACEEILIRPEPGAELVSMAEQMGLAAPVRFDETLRAALGIDVGDVSQVATVRLVFKNPEALTAFYAELAQWMREDTTSEDEDGEPDPT